MVLTALRADGTEAGTYALPGQPITVGRDTGGIFAGDSYLSPRHATFTRARPKLFVKDEGSLNGVYKKLAPEAAGRAATGDIFRIGQEIIRFELLSPAGLRGRRRRAPRQPLEGLHRPHRAHHRPRRHGQRVSRSRDGIHLGRERGDVLFPEDGYVSGLHCRIGWDSGRAYLTDLGSSNGTFVRLNEEREVRNGDVLLMGQQLFRVNF